MHVDIPRSTNRVSDYMAIVAVLRPDDGHDVLLLKHTTAAASGICSGSNASPPLPREGSRRGQLRHPGVGPWPAIFSVCSLVDY